MVIMSVGLATGFTLIAVPQFEASILARATGVALLVGLVYGLGTAFLLEYVTSTMRSRKRRQERRDPESSEQESSNEEPAES